jgi:hypothetical protein
MDAPDVTAQIELPAHAHLVAGGLEWQGDLSAKDKVSFEATIVFTRAGDAAVFCRANKRIDAENSWGDMDELYLSIGNTTSHVGYADIPLDERDMLGQVISPGDGQIISTATGLPCLVLDQFGWLLQLWPIRKPGKRGCPE